MPKSKRPSPIASRSRAAAGCVLSSVVATHGRRALAGAPATGGDERSGAPAAVMLVVVASLRRSSASTAWLYGFGSETEMSCSLFFSQRFGGFASARDEELR